MATTQNNNNAVQHNQFTGTTTTPSMTSSKRKKRSGFKKLFRFGKRGKKKEGDEQSFFDASVIAEEPTPHEHQQWMTPKNFDPTAVPKDGSSLRQSAKSKPKRSSSRPPPPSMPKSWLARTSFFKNMVDNAFTAIDADGSGDIDEKELYSGLLLIHLQLGAYAGPAACKPISREKCHAVFLKMDVDGSGHLDKAEFAQVMMVLFGNVMMRVVFQYAATLMLVPLLAQYILKGLTFVFGLIPQIWNDYIDPYTPLDEFFEGASVQIQSKIIELTQRPDLVLKVRNMYSTVLEKVPDSVWATIPLTLISSVLGMMIVPWTLMKIDDFFQSMADKKKKEGSNTDEKKKKQ